ncbi:hypothetical protein N7450_001180 [Penicillium hetheringtonii]|nr:hypothetical protein N7450_001180 [Penicillium hetheringtonii]
MEGHRQLHPYWYNWFPVRERILDTHPLVPNEILLVDIGGRGGQELIGFKRKFPEAVGRLVLEDLPVVIDEIRGNPDLKASGIESIGYDFFEDVQPVTDARVYYIKNVLHDWPDDKVVIILENIKPAMKAGYSKLIIEEYILPNRNARLLPCMVDLGLRVFCSGMERTRQQWSDLITSVGLTIQKFWIHDSDRMGIIEVELFSANRGKTGFI